MRYRSIAVGIDGSVTCYARSIPGRRAWSVAHDAPGAVLVAHTTKVDA